jgi:hypothetical protein
MHGFDLWSPCLETPRTLVFDVTPSEPNPPLKEISRGWLLQALRDLQIEGDLSRWTMRPVRTNFYSDYPEEPDWKDRWRKAWVVRVEFSTDVGFAPSGDWMPRGTNAADSSAEFGYSDPAHETNALAAAAFAGDTREPDSIQSTLLDLLKQDPAGKNASALFTVHSFPGAWQVRLLLSKVEFPQCVSMLDAIRSQLKERGAAITWKHALTVGLRPSSAPAPSQTGISDFSDDGIRSVLRSQHPGILGLRGGAEFLSQEYRGLPPERQALLAQTLRNAIFDAELEVRTNAARFFQLRPEVPDNGALGRALEDPSSRIAEQAAKSLAEKAMSGDQGALGVLRRQALEHGRAAPLIVPLSLADHEWLFEHAAEIIAGSPEAAATLFNRMLSVDIDLRPTVSALAGRVPRPLLQQALEESGAPNPQEILKSFT